MIKIKRGSTEVKDGKRAEGSWKGVILEDGQPGYDKATNTLKIGNGSDKWSKLKSLGLNLKQVLDSEKNAKKRLDQDPGDTTIFTYGTEAPYKDMAGQVYLHLYDGPLEADYVTDIGTDNGWTYRKWFSGWAECWCTKTVNNIQFLNSHGDIFNSSAEIGPVKYPTLLSFITPPAETVTVMPNLESVSVKNHVPISTWVGAQNTTTQSSSLYLFVDSTQINNLTNNSVLVQYKIVGRSK